MRPRDIRGERSGRLVAAEPRGRGEWLCRCDCGDEIVLPSSRIRLGQVKSCGCIGREKKPTVAPAPIAGAAWIPLTRGQWALVDEQDHGAVAEFDWSCMVAGRTFYGRRDIRVAPKTYRVERLHSFIWQRMGRSPVDHVDHRDGNGLNCKRDNLRGATVSQNVANQRLRYDSTTGFKGVTFNRRLGRWLAQICSGERRRIGWFDSPEDAARAYDKAATEVFGEFARTNKMLGLLPDDEPTIEMPAERPL